MDKLDGRYVSDVKEFTLEKIQEWINDSTFEDAIDGDVDEAYIIIDTIAGGDTLYKYQAEWLARLIDRKVADGLDVIQWSRSNGRGGNLALDIDELSIYADMWGLYCRPGVYKLNEA